MKYLSFDVGIKNLAYCSLNQDKKILDWGIINLNKNPLCQCGLKKDCNKVATYQVTDSDNHEIICIENQPALKNPTMKSIQMLLYSYFMIEGVTKDKSVEQVHMINARNKLKVYNGPPVECNIKEKYKRNKYLSVEYTKNMILQQDKKFIDLFDESKKKDDLADAYLQGIYFIDK